MVQKFCLKASGQKLPSRFTEIHPNSPETRWGKGEREDSISLRWCQSFRGESVKQSGLSESLPLSSQLQKRVHGTEMRQHNFYSLSTRHENKGFVVSSFSRRKIKKKTATVLSTMVVENSSSIRGISYSFVSF
ncbi:hypothetical protein CDAR_510541 [Caerostris darwini]|uniref:Uncharacterized protein n=1 Tax=Caerostris darwini TaxID=1538125 RepID=A0AAV4UGQ9_9ARAC|nr:hypothetical protein CDAR_510541 [Caerostris darwini]